MLLIQVSLCYILKHLEDRKAWYVHSYYTWCDIILIFKLHRRTRPVPCSSIQSLKIRMTSHPYNKYEHTTLSYLLSVNYLTAATFVIGIPPKNWVIELTYPDLLIDMAWNKIITTNVIFFYSRDQSIPLKSDRVSNRWISYCIMIN